MEEVTFEQLKSKYQNHPVLTILEQMEGKLTLKFFPLLEKVNGATSLLRELPDTFAPQEIISPSPIKQRAWELVGLFYFNLGRFYEAIPIFERLYEHMLHAQEETEEWYHKGMPLFWISECFKHLGFPVLAKRYMMLALCEDAINGNGSIHPDTVGTYFQLVWFKGLSDFEINKYATEIHKIFSDNPKKGLFPEYILQRMDAAWMTEMPSPSEGAFYVINRLYAKNLMNGLGSSSGKELEFLAHYLLSCMPGCISFNRKRSYSTDYDIVCTMEGFEVDFRSELGRYFVCECKDWAKAANFTSFAKFCRVLDSIKSRFGIMFSKKGISGKGLTKNAEREQLKVFQDRGIVIIVVDENDLNCIIEGENFIKMLRDKYERIRLDLTH